MPKRHIGNTKNPVGGFHGLHWTQEETQTIPEALSGASRNGGLSIKSVRRFRVLLTTMEPKERGPLVSSSMDPVETQTCSTDPKNGSVFEHLLYYIVCKPIHFNGS